MSKIDKPRKEDGLSRRDFLQSSSAATLAAMLGAVPSAAQPAHKVTSATPEGNKAPKEFKPDAGFPRVWLSSAEGVIPSSSFEDIASHGVQVIETTDIQSARKYGLQAMLASNVGGMFMGKVIGPEARVCGGDYRHPRGSQHRFAYVSVCQGQTHHRNRVAVALCSL
jgi:hypothetical protein